MSDIQYFRTFVLIEEGQPNIPESHILRVVLASHYDAALAREAALRNDVLCLEKGGQLIVQDMRYYRERLAVAEQLLGEIIHSGEWNSSALEFTGCDGFEVLEKIEAVLKPAAEVEQTKTCCGSCPGGCVDQASSSAGKARDV